MELSPALTADLVEIVSERTRRARVAITGASMEPLLRAGMVVDIEPLTGPPCIGDILVFRSLTGLIAHRLVGGEMLRLGARDTFVAERLVDANAGSFVTGGDAHPDRTETVPRRLVVGRVSAVWDGSGPGAQRIDDAAFRRRGTFAARTRGVRAAAARISAYRRVFLDALVTPGAAAGDAQGSAFAALVGATHHFEHGRNAAGAAALGSVPAAQLVELVRRHHASGLVANWLDAAVRSGVGVPGDLHERFRRLRRTNALQAGRVLSCVREVRACFTAAEIPHIFLKGGGRIAAGEPDAHTQFSADVDVLVPAEAADRAMAALRAAGYVDIQTDHWRSMNAGDHHHREPLLLPRTGVPVEVHHALAPLALVSERLDYAALEPLSRWADGPIGAVKVLDSVGAALHLAYHARDLHVWRDIVLLARLLRAFDAAERARFDAHARRETLDRLRLTSAVAAADAIAFARPASAPAVRRYLAWVDVRECLPRRFGSQDILEAVLGRCRMPKLGLRTRSRLTTWLRCWLRNLAQLPSVIRFMRRHARTQAARSA